MDIVTLKRAQLKTLREQDKDVAITAHHPELGMVYVEPLKYVGEGKGNWLKQDGKWREDA